MTAWIVNRAGRAALGVSAVLLVAALVMLYVGYRFASWPVRRCARGNPAAARRAAVFSLIGAVGATVAVFRETARELDDDDQELGDEPGEEPGGGLGYTPAP